MTFLTCTRPVRMVTFAVDFVFGVDMNLADSHIDFLAT